MLSEKLRKQYMEALGYTYDKAGIKKMQSDYMARKSDVDGAYGNNTDILLRNLYNFKLSGIVKHFKLNEFKCKCGGKYCSGYPTVVSQAQLKMMEAIRTHYGKPITVTCGLRCRTYNSKIGGSIINSSHLSGYATDYYQAGVTDTLSHRKAAISWIKKQKNHSYTYGNGCNSKGNYISAPYMGNALHTDTKTSVKDIYPEIKKYMPPSIKKSYSGEFPNITTTTNHSQEIVDMCKKLCYPNGTDSKKWDYGTGAPTAAYKAAFKKYNSRYKDSKINLSDCGMFVSTVVRACGVDPKYTGLDWKTDYTKSSKWDQVHTGAIGSFKLKPGDIVEYKKKNGNQHTVIVIDHSKGIVAEAGRGHRFDIIHKASRYTASTCIKSSIRVLRAKESKNAKVVPLARGDKRTVEVEKLQKFLKWYGYSITVDKVFGDKTEKLVKDFQAANGLTVDGKVGAKTIAKMKAIKK